MQRNSIFAAMTLVVCIAASLAPRANASADQAGRERLEALIRSTDALRSFVAEYSLSKPGEEPQSMRIVYAAPGRGMIVSPGKMYFRLMDGFVDLRQLDDAKGSSFAHFEFARANEARYRRFEDVLRAQFSALADKEFTPTACGPVLGLRIAQPGEIHSGEERTAEFQFSFQCPGDERLRWLRDFQQRADGKSIDADHLQFDAANGAAVVLSLRTGFVESVVRDVAAGRVEIRLKELELDQELDGAAFELPVPGTGWTDLSTAMARGMHVGQTLRLRQVVMSSLGRLVEKGALVWDETQAGHLEALLTALHSDSLALEREAWIADVRRSIDEYAAWLEAAFERAPEAAPEASARLERDAIEWRQKLAENVRSARTRYVEGCAASSAPKSEFEQSFRACERKAADLAFGTVVEKPMLEHFDEQVARIER